MSSQTGDDGHERATVRKLAGAAIGAAALSGVASAEDADSYLFDPAEAGVEDAVGFVSADAAALGEHDDLLEFETADLKESWRTDGTASLEEIAADLEERVDEPVSDAWTVVDESGVAAEEIDRVGAVGSTTLGTDDRLGGLAVEGSFDGAAVVDALGEVTELESTGGDAYDRYRVQDDRLEGDVVVAAADGSLLVGGTGDLDADGGTVVDRLIAASEGEAPRLGPGSTHVGAILDELSDVPAVAGVEWTYAGESANLVPDSLEGPLRAHGALPDDVELDDLTADVGALALGVDPDGPRTVGVVAYDGDPPVDEAGDVVDAVEAESDRLDEVDVSVAGSGDLLVVEASTTADHLTSVQEGARDTVRAASTLRSGVTRGAIPSLKGAYRTAADYWEAFVDDHL